MSVSDEKHGDKRGPAACERAPHSPNGGPSRQTPPEGPAKRRAKAGAPTVRSGVPSRGIGKLMEEVDDAAGGRGHAVVNDPLHVLNGFGLVEVQPAGHRREAIIETGWGPPGAHAIQRCLQRGGWGGVSPGDTFNREKLVTTSNFGAGPTDAGE